MKDKQNQLWSKTKPTKEQKRVAKLLGVELASDDSFLIAAARIEDAVADAVGDEPISKPSKNQERIASEIGLDISMDSHRVAWNKIKQKWQLDNYEANVPAARNMNLKPGDRVIKHLTIKAPSGDIKFEKEYIVSSIRWDGFVYFKGTGCNCAWAKTLTKLDADNNRHS